MHKDCMKKKNKKYYDLDCCDYYEDCEKDKKKDMKVSPMFVYPVDLCNCEIFNILCNSIGKVIGLKLADSNCILRLCIYDVNSCGVLGKTPSGKGPIYVKLSAIQYVDFGKETYVNPLCSTSTSTGVPGPKGDKGDMGPKGDKGDTGTIGPKGDKGDTGAVGSKGDKGDMGSKGPKGDKGDMGPKGPKGDKGDTGAVGPKGDKGDTGAVGPKGDKGDTGAVGPKGDKGDTGAVGPKGDKGNMGPKGAKGDKGDSGYVAPDKKVKEKYMPPKKIPYKN